MAYDSNTKLLIHFNGADGATSYTAETGQTVTFAGTAQLDTAQKEFGSAALLLDGDSDYVTVPDSADWNFGTGNFTIDFWMRTTTDQNQGYYEQRVDDNNRIQIWSDVAGTDVYFYAKATAVIAYYSFAITPFSTGIWYHIALVRNGTSMLFFVNGVSQVATEITAISTTAMPDIVADLSIGFKNGAYFDGHIDEVRVSKGIARWTVNFTPPTREYTSVGKNKGILI